MGKLTPRRVLGYAIKVAVGVVAIVLSAFIFNAIPSCATLRVECRSYPFAAPAQVDTELSEVVSGYRLLADLASGEGSDSNRRTILAHRDAAQKLLDIRLSNFASVAHLRLSTAGGKKATGVTVDVPGCTFAQVVRPGADVVEGPCNGVVSVGDITPGKRVEVWAWTSYAQYPARNVVIRLDEGSATVTRFHEAKQRWLSLDDLVYWTWKVFMFLGFLTAMVVVLRILWVLLDFGNDGPRPRVGA